MNFFAHQDRARRNSRMLVMLFLLAVLGIVVAVNLVVGLFFGLFVTESAERLYGHVMATPDLWSLARENAGAIALISAGTVGLIGLASAIRMAMLGSGGARVAEAMGGTLVPPDTMDPELRRLRNVVEEVALASGVSTPQVFVLEHEPGINAFAAGYSPADAAVAVTRGTLDTLTRDELQGVIAHEFSHIVNGDMRLNIRLMGILFGILVIGVIGRFLMRSGGRSSGSRGRNQGGLVAVGVGLFLIGYIGVFFGRLIKAAVSRQREFLADASAVQFTRQPEGIGGALKKIGALSQGSHLQAPDTEEVSHMLFANGLRSFGGMLSTHPPLVERIRAIDPRFRPEQFDEVRKALQQRLKAAAEVRRTAAEEEARPRAGAIPGLGDLPGVGQLPGVGESAIPGAVLAGAVLADIEKPGPERLERAAALIHGIPEPLYHAAHEANGAPAAVLAMLLGEDATLRDRRVERIDAGLGADIAARVRELVPAATGMDPAVRLPLMELCIPALRQREGDALRALLAVVQDLIVMDGRISVFEYALGRLLARHIRDILKPRSAAPGGRRKLVDCREQAVDLLSVLAWHGQTDETGARGAFDTGIGHLFGMDRPAYRAPQNWVQTLDQALERLDGLDVLIKQALVQAVVATVTADGEVTVEEAELVRAMCGRLHVPVPPLVAGLAGQGRSPEPRLSRD